MHFLSTFSLWVGALLGVAQGLVTSKQPTVDLGYVQYAGITNETVGITYFRGIRYAVPPLGQLRWRAPLPIELETYRNRSRTIQAVAAPQLCFQSGPVSILTNPDTSESYMPNVPQGEDCLFLNVLKPERPVNTSLPVIVLIHGGGYTMGGPYISPGDSVVHASKGQVIYVEIQYRLGAFGFLAGNAVGKDGNYNVGLLDQRLALEWVQRHIKAFGGDPQRVTIWGGSAGGGSVTLQLTAYGAYDKPPFQAAIAEYPWWTPLLNKTTQEVQYRNTLKAANCSNLACLRSLPTAALGKVNQLTQNISYTTPGLGYGVFYFGPVVDGIFVPSLPDVSFKKGAFHKVPFLTDREEYEGYTFSNKSVTTQAEETQDAQLLFPFAGPSFFSRLYQHYPASDYNSTFFQRQTWFGDFIINCPTYQMATAMVDQSPTPEKVFKMHFTAGGGKHAATTAFLTSEDVSLSGASNTTLAHILVNYFVSFAVHHDPNPGKLADAPYWPSYNSGGGDVSGLAAESIGFRVLRVNEGNITTEPDPDNGAKCDFFSSQGQTIRN